MKRKLLILFILLLVIAAGVFLVVRKKTQLAEAPRSTQRPVPVETAVSRSGDLALTRTYLGLVEPWLRSDVSARITASIREVAVREGEEIEKGQVLLRLDDTELDQAVQNAAAQLENARRQTASVRTRVATLEKTVAYRQKEYERDRILAAEGAIAQAEADAGADRLNRERGELDAARESLRAAESLARSRREQLEEVRSRRGYATLRAPFNGVVSQRQADPGDMAVPGRSLLTMEDHSRLKILFDVPQKDLDRFRPQRPITIDDDGKDLLLEVSRRYPSLNADRTLTMEVDLPADSGFTAGAYEEIEATLEQAKDAILVPVESLVPTPKGEMVVFVVEENSTRAQPVDVLLIDGKTAAVDGLEEGTAVVRSTYLGWNRLSEGVAVEVKP
ncbi:MAG TPA: efflux RND transporter periplasmic adaptor subunit [Desulfuromonadales bacterium]|nr:efflux RND transporter periplasmic adaptor subunit [Desulfuromonadales bacterium]